MVRLAVRKAFGEKDGDLRYIEVQTFNPSTSRAIRELSFGLRQEGRLDTDPSFENRSASTHQSR